MKSLCLRVETQWRRANHTSKKALIIEVGWLGDKGDEEQYTTLRCVWSQDPHDLVLNWMWEVMEGEWSRWSLKCPAWTRARFMVTPFTDSVTLKEAGLREETQLSFSHIESELPRLPSEVIECMIHACGAFSRVQGWSYKLGNSSAGEQSWKPWNDGIPEHCH